MTSVRPRVATNGRGFLIVWQQLSAPRAVHAVLINENSSSRELGAVVTTGLGEMAEFPAVASDGNHFLVVWRKFFRFGNGWARELEGVVVSETGTVEKAKSFTEPIYFDTYQAVDLAWNGKDYFLIWQDVQPGRGPTIRGTIVSPSGEAAHPRGQVFSYGPNSQTTAAVAFNGSEYLVVWQDNRFDESEGHSALFGTRVSAAGKILDPDLIRISQSSSGIPAIATHQREFFVVWGGNPLYAARVSREGKVLNGQDILIAMNPRASSAPANLFLRQRSLRLARETRRDGP